MKLGLVTYNVARNWDIETIIERLEQARFEAVELRTTHKHGVEPSLSNAERDQVRERFQRSKVRLLSLGTACEFHSPEESERRRNVEETQRFVVLAHDLGCLGVKVRPNDLPDGVPEDVTLRRIAESLRECGDYARGYGVEIWVEVHGRKTEPPPVMRKIMDLCGHSNVGVCWNCNPADVKAGSIDESFDLLGPFIRNVHLKELPDYPHRALFQRLRQSGYDRYTLAEVDESSEPERFLKYYQALWTELQRP